MGNKKKLCIEELYTYLDVVASTKKIRIWNGLDI
jgi:hypothetical protein